MRSSGTLFCLASGAAFGAMAVFGKLAYDEGATVATLLAVRFVLAAALFWVLVLATGGAGEARALSRRDVAVALALGACGYAIQAGCYFAALQRIDASLLALVLYTFPAIVAAAAVVLGRERMDARRLVALALASGGLALVLAGAGTGALEPVGVALALGAALVYSAYILVGDTIVGRMRAAAVVGARLHRRGGVADRRLAAARRAASGRAEPRRLGLAGVPGRRVDRRRRRASSSPGCAASGRRRRRSSPRSSRW